MIFAVALALLAQAPPTERIAGFFRTEWECKSYMSTVQCGCQQKVTPRYILDDAQGNSREIYLDAKRVASYGGPKQLEGKWLVAECETPIEATHPTMRNFGVVDATTLKLALHLKKFEVLDGMSERAKSSILAPIQDGMVHMTSGQSKPYLTVLCRTADTTTITPRPATDYDALMGTTYPMLNHYIRNMSYGTWNLDGSKTVGWMNLPKNKSEYETVRTADNALVWDHVKLLDDIVPILDPTIDFSKFAGINICLNTNDNSGGLYASGYFMKVDGLNGFMPITEMSDSFLPGPWAHEIGHDFSFDHSSGPYNTPYDSLWDVMSGGHHNVPDPTFGTLFIANGYNAYHRRQAGWISKERVQFLFPGDSKTFHLERLTDPTNVTDPLMAKVFISGSAKHYYTVEARKPVGYDITVPDGVVIHDVLEDRFVNDSNVAGPRFDRSAQVVDPDNNGDPNDASAQWKPGETYTDAAAGIKISVLSGDATGYTVKITVNANQPSPGVVFSGKDDGAGTLRDWLYFRKDFPDAQLNFRIPKTDASYDSAKGFFRIRLQTPMPELAQTGLVIDGATQTTFTGDTNPKGPEIMLDGTACGEFSFGLKLKGAGQVVRNIAIGNFKAAGIIVDGAPDVTIQKCYVGVEPDGTTLASNAWEGVSFVNGAKRATFGGANSGNLVSGNLNTGLNLWDAGTADNKILGNMIGTDRLGLTAIPNKYAGIGVNTGVAGTIIGTKTYGEGNLVSGNSADGISVGDATGTRVSGNKVGTNAAGTAALPNGGWGVSLGGANTGTVVGGSSAGEGNLLSANGAGVGAIGTGVKGLTIEGNYIGTDAKGLAAIPNVYLGIYLLNGPSAVVRGNLVSGNSGSGIVLSGAGAVTVENNLIGTDSTGLVALPNNGAGISVINKTSNALIGGASGLENVISGNNGDGIAMGDVGTAGNHISGNLVGLARNGTVVPNKGNGFWIGNGTTNNFIGEPGKPNVIGGNLNSGIVIGTAGTTGNRIRSNYIGVTPNGDAKPNKADGVVFYGGAKSNFLGGVLAGEGNRIAFNQFGVSVVDDATTGNSIRGNSISDNAKLGIQIWKADGAYGVTPNDNGDGDSGPNNVQNFPILTKGTRNGSGITITGTYNGVPNATVTIDIYANASPDNSGYGEGQAWLTSKTITTNASGDATLSFGVTSTSLNGLSASATGADGSTSEFSPCADVTSGLSSLSVNPTSVTGGTNSIGLITLFGVAPAAGETVTSSSSNTNVATVPASANLPSSTDNVSFTITTKPVTKVETVKITATYDGVSKVATLTVNPAGVAKLVIDPTSAIGETQFTGTVTLTGPAPAAGQKVTLSVDKPTLAKIPAFVVVPSGSTSASVVISTIKVAADSLVTAKAEANGSSATGTFTIQQTNTIALSLAPTSVAGSLNSTATVTLGYQAPAGGQVVTLTSDHPEAIVPPSVTIPAGLKTATFAVKTTPVTATVAAKLKALANGKSAAAFLSVRPPKVVALTITPASAFGGSKFAGAITLDGPAPSGGVPVALTVDHSEAASFPASVLVAEGSKTASFSITSIPVAANTKVIAKASANAGAVAAAFTVLAQRPLALSFSPASVFGGQSSAGTVTITGLAPTAGQIVKLTSNNAAVKVPASVTIAAGQTTADFAAASLAVGKTVVVTLTATANGASVKATLEVRPPTVIGLAVTPSSVTGGTSSTGKVTISSPAPSTGLKITLTNSNVAAATVPLTVTVAAGQTTATFAVPTKPVTADTSSTITASFSGSSATATLTIKH